MIESNDQDWGLCDHGLVGREFDDDAEEDYGDAWDEFDEQDDDDDEWPMAHMARVAADIEAGRAEVPRGWKLDRPGPGHPGVDHSLGSAVRLHPDRRMAAGARDQALTVPSLESFGT